MHSAQDWVVYGTCAAMVAMGILAIVLGIRFERKLRELANRPEQWTTVHIDTKPGSFTRQRYLTIDSVTVPVRRESEPMPLPTGEHVIVYDVSANGTPLTMKVRPMTDAERDRIERAYDRDPDNFRERRIDG